MINKIFITIFIRYSYCMYFEVKKLETRSVEVNDDCASRYALCDAEINPLSSAEIKKNVYKMTLVLLDDESIRCGQRGDYREAIIIHCAQRDLPAQHRQIQVTNKYDSDCAFLGHASNNAEPTN
mmetsp:Transcript_5911/g.8280  ORF Transcript_5911/g.8280 Transcript_5911/m.8280 type:complete len:124 (-) Transcript_5911:707-1078(-)